MVKLFNDLSRLQRLEMMVVALLQAHGWSNYLNRGSTASSEELGRKHSRSQIEANR